jgi:hypothetical protein
MMRRIFAGVAVAAVSMTVVGVGAASAAEIEIDPLAPEAGEVALTITVSDFDPNTPIFAVPCEIPASGEQVDIANASCDFSKVAAATTDPDGEAIIRTVWVIPEGGIAVFVGDEMRENQVTMILGTTPAATTDIPEVEVLGTSVVQEDLADTGPRKTMLLVMVGAALLAIGGTSSALRRSIFSDLYSN